MVYRAQRPNRYLPEEPEPIKANPTCGPLSYPSGLACIRVEFHRYQTGVRIHELLITPLWSRETLTLLVHHQPFRQPQLSLRPSRARSTPGVRYIYAAEMVPYDPELADADTSNASSCRRPPSSQV